MEKEKTYNIEYVDIKDINPAAYNPRKHDKEMLNNLEKSITEFGLVDPVIVNNHPDRFNALIGGHARYKIAKKLKYTKIPVVYISLTEEEEKILNLKLNAISGDWDFSKLDKLFEEDFLIDLGFSQTDFEDYWNSVLESEDDTFDTEKELEKIHNPKTKKGDLIILGGSKLLCASATDPHAVKKLFGSDKASMYYSDPPFNTNLNYDKGVGNKSSYGGKVDDNKSPEEYKDFIRQTLTSALPVLTNDVHLFMWCDEAWVWVFQTLYNELGIKNRRLNIWLKNNASPTPQVAFNKVIEVCCYGTIGKPYLSKSHRNLNGVQNKDASTGNELFDQVTNVWATKRLAGTKYNHPTEKNPDLHQKAILRCTKPGDIIFDSFSGSASTMICAHQLKRKVYSCEISEVFCDLAIRRYEQLTGEKAQVIKNYYEEK